MVQIGTKSSSPVLFWYLEHSPQPPGIHNPIQSKCLLQQEPGCSPQGLLTSVRFDSYVCAFPLEAASEPPTASFFLMDRLYTWHFVPYRVEEKCV